MCKPTSPVTRRSKSTQTLDLHFFFFYLCKNKKTVPMKYAEWL